MNYTDNINLIKGMREIFKDNPEALNIINSHTRDLKTQPNNPMSALLNFAEKTTSSYCLQSMLSINNPELVEKIIRNIYCNSDIKKLIVDKYATNQAVLNMMARESGLEKEIIEAIDLRRQMNQRTIKDTLLTLKIEEPEKHSSVDDKTSSSSASPKQNR